MQLTKREILGANETQATSGYGLASVLARPNPLLKELDTLDRALALLEKASGNSFDASYPAGAFDNIRVLESVTAYLVKRQLAVMYSLAQASWQRLVVLGHAEQLGFTKQEVLSVI